MKSAGAGEWLEKALQDLCKNMETGLDLDSDLISGLVSFCELAPPEDAKEYLNNIVGQEAGQSVIEEYLQLRGYTDNSTASASNSKLQAYVKPPPGQGSSSGTKKQARSTKELPVSHNQENKAPTETTGHRSNKVDPGTSKKKKKSGKAISLAEAAKGTIIFQQGKPCSCQARRHRLVSNCLSCGKIVCEQEGEGPCSFCGALVLKEGSTYAGLDETVIPLSESEATAEAFAKRLVDYDRNSAARTTVIDDQSDYYEIDSNSWLSKEEKHLLKKKQQEIEEVDKARRNKVVMTFDLVGRKVLINKDEAELETENRILRQPDERELNRIKPNPTVKVQPVFVDPGRIKKDPVKGKQQKKKPPNGLCLEISGRVQHDGRELPRSMAGISNDDANIWRGPSVSGGSHTKQEEYECSLE